MNVGQKVRVARAHRGIKSQSDLARATDLSRAYLSLLEDADEVGSRKVSDLQKVADALRVPLGWLLEKDAPEPNWDAPAESGAAE